MMAVVTRPRLLCSRSCGFVLPRASSVSEDNTLLRRFTRCWDAPGTCVVARHSTMAAGNRWGWMFLLSRLHLAASGQKAESSRRCSNTIADITHPEYHVSPQHSVVQFLRRRLGLGADEAAVVVKAHPGLKEVGLDMLQAHLDFLTGCGVDASDLARDVDILAIPLVTTMQVKQILAGVPSAQFQWFYPFCRIYPDLHQRLRNHLLEDDPSFVHQLAEVLCCSVLDSARICSRAYYCIKSTRLDRLRIRATQLFRVGITTDVIMRFPRLLKKSARMVEERSARCRQLNVPITHSIFLRDEGQFAQLLVLSDKLGRASDDPAAYVAERLGVQRSQVAELMRNRLQMLANINRQRFLDVTECLFEAGYSGEEQLYAMPGVYLCTLEYLRTRLDACRRVGIRPQAHVLQLSRPRFQRTLLTRTQRESKLLAAGDLPEDQ